MKRLDIRSLSVGLLITLAPVSAQAESENNSELDEIVVTAERRSNSLQNVPIAITALSGPMLEARGVQDMFDLQFSAPGLIVSHNFQGQVYLRGIGTDLQGIGSDASIAVHLDGVYLPRPNAVVMNFFDVERIEVLRGPQGTLYGRNAAGGVINIVSRQPTRDLSASAELLYGNYDKLRLQAALSGPIVEDKVLARIAVMNSDRDGFTRNLATGSRLSDENFTTARAMLQLLPTENFDVLFSVDGTRDRSRTATVHHVDYGDNIAAALGGRFSDDPYIVYHDLEGPFRRDQWGGSMKLNWRPGTVSITALSAYRASRSRRVVDSDGTDFPLIGEPGSTESSDAYSQEIQVASTGSGPLEWLFGAYYMHENASAEYVISSPPADLLITIPATIDTHAWAGFGQVSYAVSDALKLTAGLRYSRETKDEFNASTANGVVVGTGGGKKTWSAWTPKFGIDYRIDDNVLLYGSISRGFKSGGFNSTGFQPAFEPEYVWSYEAGLKSDLFDNRVRLNLSAFYYDYSNLQLNVLVGASSAVRNAASARIYGGEAELHARFGGFEIEGGLALLHARFGQLLTDDPNLPGSPTVDLKGNRLPRAPKVAGNIALQYSWDLGAAVLTARADLQYQSHIFFSQYNYAKEEQDGFGLLNARLTYRADRWTVALFGRNLTDKAYLVNGTRVDVIGGSVAGYFGQPRTYGVSVGFTY